MWPPTPEQEHEHPQLRSVKEVTGYHINASDGDIGHIEDFIVETYDWSIRYFVVDTRNWLPGRKVLVSTQWITAVTWASRTVDVELSKRQVEGSPEFDPAAPVNRRYEERFYDYYGRPGYWAPTHSA